MTRRCVLPHLTRSARKVAEDRVVFTLDEQARHARTSGSALRDGYRDHVAAGPETGIITGEKLTMATGDGNTDAAVAAELAAVDPADPLPWYGNSAYGTGELRAALATGGH